MSHPNRSLANGHAGMKPHPIWLVPLTQSEEASIQMVWLPPTAGGFSNFLSWSRPQTDGRFFFPQQVSLWGAQFSWTSGWTFAALAEAVADAIAADLEVGPFVLGGYSFGGLLAFGVARTLRKLRFRAPLGLMVAAMRAPQGYRPGCSSDQWTLDDWRTELARLGGTPDDVLNDPAKLQPVVANVCAGLEIAASYQYTEAPPFDFPIAAFSGRKDPEFSPEEVLAWCQQTTRQFTAHIYPKCGHFDLLYTPSIRAHFLADVVATLEGWQRSVA
jgi:medium-chain acyl-[acyl-carrier-protein] hydrolase